MPKLARLRALKEALAHIEGQRASVGDREAGVQALTVVVDYLDNVGAEAATLRELLASFLVKQKTTGGLAGSPVKDSLCGKIAGIVFLKSLTNGNQTREAADWVSKHLPVKLHRALAPPQKGKVSDRVVYSWYERWGGAHGDAGDGRDGYRMIVDAGTRNPSKHPSDQVLRNILKTLAASPGLPSN